MSRRFRQNGIPIRHQRTYPQLWDRLLRWLAAEWFLGDARSDRAQELLRDARSLAPGDAKTASLAWLTSTTPGLARCVLWAWRHLRPGSLRMHLRLAAELRGVCRFLLAARSRYRCRTGRGEGPATSTATTAST